MLKAEDKTGGMKEEQKKRMIRKCLLVSPVCFSAVMFSTTSEISLF